METTLIVDTRDGSDAVTFIDGEFAVVLHCPSEAQARLVRDCLALHVSFGSFEHSRTVNADYDVNDCEYGRGDDLVPEPHGVRDTFVPRPGACHGHPAPTKGLAGETVYCDGSCNPEGTP